MLRIAIITLLTGALIAACTMPPRQQIRIVGSSTVYPFIAAAAEQFGRATDFATPIVEATGTGGGFKLFCAGVGEAFPDIANASRPIKDAERDLCAKAGVKEITELAIGYDGIVLAKLKQGQPLDISREQLFRALAKELPDADGKLVENPYTRWSEIDPALPDTEIAVYGPPPTSGTRDAFVELVMEPACIELPAFVAAYPDKEIRKNECHQLREDGHFVDAGENDNIIVQKLKSNEEALGLFGYSFLDQQRDALQGMKIEGVLPEFDRIASGDYKISRSLYIYIKDAHRPLVPGITEFVEEVKSERASGPEGYMTLKGLIPLNRDTVQPDNAVTQDTEAQ